MLDSGRSGRDVPFRLDLSESTSNPTYPIISSTDCSPCTEPLPFGELDKTFSDESAYALEDYINPGLFEKPLNSVELTSTFPPHKSQQFDPSANMNQWNFPTAPTPFGVPGTFTDAFTNGLPFGTLNHDSGFGSLPPSPTPSGCGDSSRPSLTVSSPALTNNSLKRESSEPADDEPAPKRVARKRGRPRLHRADSDPGSNDDGKARQSRRLPHNQVERKYREGLNAELERLRRAVPTLPQRDSTDLTSPPKPSKATVLASAIDYIKSIEAERDQLRRENESLRGMRPSAVNSTSKLNSFAWSKPRPDSTNSNNLAITS